MAHPPPAWSAFVASRPAPVHPDDLEPVEPCDLIDADTIAYYLTIRRPRWMSRAACRDADPDLFFAPGTSPRKRAAALAICAGCGVREQCLEYALRFDRIEDVGVWGGTDADGRRRLRELRDSA